MARTFFIRERDTQIEKYLNIRFVVINMVKKENLFPAKQKRGIYKLKSQKMVPANRQLIDSFKEPKIHPQICGTFRTATYYRIAYIIAMKSTLDWYTENELSTHRSKSLQIY